MNRRPIIIGVDQGAERDVHVYAERLADGRLRIVEMREVLHALEAVRGPDGVWSVPDA